MSTKHDTRTPATQYAVDAVTEAAIFASSKAACEWTLERELERERWKRTLVAVRRALNVTLDVVRQECSPDDYDRIVKRLAEGAAGVPRKPIGNA